MQDEQKACLLYMLRVTNRIFKMFRKKNMTTTFLPTATIGSLLRSMKQLADLLHTSGIFKVFCECGRVYVGQTTMAVTAEQFGRKCHLGLLQPYQNILQTTESCLKCQQVLEDIILIFDERLFRLSNTLLISVWTIISIIVELGSQSCTTSRTNQHRSNPEEMSYHPL